MQVIIIIHLPLNTLSIFLYKVAGNSLTILWLHRMFSCQCTIIFRSHDISILIASLKNWILFSMSCSLVISLIYLLSGYWQLEPKQLVHNQTENVSPLISSATVNINIIKKYIIRFETSHLCWILSWYRIVFRIGKNQILYFLEFVSYNYNEKLIDIWLKCLLICSSEISSFLCIKTISAWY